MRAGETATNRPRRAHPTPWRLLWLPLLLEAASCSPAYLFRAATTEAAVLRRRRPIQEVIHDTTTASSVRRKLRLVQDVRAYAVRELGLEAGDSFLSFARVERDTLLLVVSAAPPYQLRWKTWWFPIVGRVPYRGYFDFGAARREAAHLASRGYDTYVRPTVAFSTLGWLPDPLLSPALRADSVGLAVTAFHEITHTTFFPAGQAHFNESFANFVGHRGAISFFCDAVASPRLCRLSRERWEDSRRLGRFYREVYDSLSALYASGAPADSMAREKRRILDGASERFDREVRPELRAGRYAGLDSARLDNAWLLSRILYYTRLDDFERIYERQPDLRVTVRRILRAASRHRKDPWKGIDELLASDARPRSIGRTRP